MNRKDRKNLTPIPDNWQLLNAHHFGTKDKFGADCGFDSGFFFMSEEHTLEIAVIEGHEYRKGRKGVSIKRTKSRALLALFCPFSGLPLYEESTYLKVAPTQVMGMQATLFG